MNLLEREHHLKKLNELILEAEGGAGRTIVVAGEAGIGKTVLIEEFVKNLGEKWRVLWGNCDALNTPRPLSPLYDLTYQMNSNLLKVLKIEHEGNSIFNGFFHEIQKENKPSLIIIEDIHWADESTIDLIKFISRRVNRTNVLLIITFRDDEISVEHPLKSLFGDIPQKNLYRIKLLPLSEMSVNYLTKINDKNIPDLYIRTGGNPFFITEVINNSDDNLPITIKDTVLSKLYRLSAETKKFIELMSVIPCKIETEFIKELLTVDMNVVDEALNAGILKMDSGIIIFKHELVRLAVEDSLSIMKKKQLNAKILHILLGLKNIDKNLASIVHHATNAEDINIILKYAPLAAEQAENLGAHREATIHYSKILNYPEHFTPEKFAVLLERYSYQCYLTDQLESAFEARLNTLKIWQDLNELKKVGSTYRWLSRISWFLGNKGSAEKYAWKAIDVLEQFPETEELAMAYSNRASLYMLSENEKDAVIWGEKAIRIAEALNNNEILAHVLNTVGTAQLENNYNETGESKLLRSLKIALDNGYEEHAARAFTNLGCRNTDNKRYEKGEKYFLEGMNYCIEHDLDSWKLYIQAWLARVYFETGRWDEAGEMAQKVLKVYRISVVSKIPALTTLGWLRLRRGDPGAIDLLNEAKELGFKTDELQRIGPVSAAFLEAAWLTDNCEEYISAGKTGHELAIKLNNLKVLGQTSYWLWKTGISDEIKGNIWDPYLKQITGDWKKSAAYWKSIGCPYEEALALSDGDVNSMLKAMEIFKKLGANPAIERLQREMRKRGIRKVPRGPQLSTVKNPLGLTKRQVDVLRLLSEGLSNADIAGSLFISSRTVDHHISAIFSKLNIHSRAEAVSFVHTKNLFEK